VWRVARGTRPDPRSAINQLLVRRHLWCALYSSGTGRGARGNPRALDHAARFSIKIRLFVHQIRVSAQRTLRLADLPALRKLGVEVDRYRNREYSVTQQIADAAYFLGFDGLIAPCARWECLNAVLFTDRISPGDIEIVEREPDAIDWEAWRKRTRSR
jgi:hypothetical protein